MNRSKGFTLVEVMIAIFIAAIMFAIGYGAINQALRDRETINASQARTHEIQRGMRVVAQDLAQIVARAARDTSGTGQLMPAVMAQGTDNVLVTFSRAGWSNPVGLQRPAEQRVRYRFFDGSLLREHWDAMDPALNIEPRQRILITKVQSAQIRFLDPVSRNWRTEWPGTTGTGAISPARIDMLLLPRPMAIEFTLVLEDWGRVIRVFEVPS